MMKRLTVLLAVLALVAAACGGSSEDTTTDTTAGAGPPAQAGGTLAEVKARGNLNCGVSEGAAGFTDISGDEFSGIDVDYCRAVAAAIFGDQNAVVFFPVSSANRFDQLKAGVFDVLFRNTTWTASRDTEVGMNFGPTTYFDGQGVMGPSSKFSANSGPADVDGRTLCTSAGTTSEKNVAEWALLGGATINLKTLDNNAAVYEALEAGIECDMATTDASNLVGERFARGHLDAGQDWVIFPPENISKEPLGPAYREGDDQWSDIIDWTVYVTFIAAEKGITSANVQAAVDAGGDPEVLRMVGVENSSIVADLGIKTDGFLDVLLQIGNYDEIFARNLAPLGIVQAGSLNDLYTRGGLIYAPPFR
jgi:general L-amino acid transport system substrate-binding protein